MITIEKGPKPKPERCFAVKAHQLKCGDVVRGTIGIAYGLKGHFMRTFNGVVMLENPMMTWDKGATIRNPVWCDVQMTVTDVEPQPQG